MALAPDVHLPALVVSQHRPRLLTSANLQGNQAPQLAEQSSDPSVGELLEAEDDETRALALVGLATTGSRPSWR